VGEADSSGKHATRAGLILTGGGARAAYQVGVLKALAEIHPSPEWPFPIIVGTSAGAVSAAILASNVTRWHQSVAEIEHVWANFHVAQVFRSDAAAMLKAGARWLGSLITGGMMGPPKSLLDNSPLRETPVQSRGFRRDPRQRRARSPARARTVRHQLFHRTFGLVLRGRNHRQ
jgi:NTE family protein